MVLLAALLAAVLLAACGGLSEDETTLPIGSGKGGPAVGTTNRTNLQDASGRTMATIDYDNVYFTESKTIGTPVAPGPNDPVLPEYPLDPLDPAKVPAFTMGALSNGAQTLHTFLVLIAGRPDTPCRFQAALAARDQGFMIWGDGMDVVNDRGVEFHEVVIARGNLYVRLDCARLKGNLGVEVITQSMPAGKIGSRQVNFVLNSIRP